MGLKIKQWLVNIKTRAALVKRLERELELVNLRIYASYVELRRIDEFCLAYKIAWRKQIDLYEEKWSIERQLAGKDNILYVLFGVHA